ncbi:undecaprenyl-diphosphate phosphatase [Deinococcus sp. KNUC1210]|uniref:undecaprenyl-diphosphate phosphatase n=1 Tax=Deinococcus sp. KNUC1210 TaxID=2917691 RepID=UPI001EF14936|nr:undecaprenyl-diphosphate phosphatase [Deinococcus sp. KNUC1210]ULH14590.1 undecaprenyl-diphosphate phosphatase [Deinococcus sp. KNUC1210]
MNAQIDAVILGVVEGLTEFLPISSTGHLIVAENLLQYKDAGETFTVVIQLGAILAVVFFYWRLLLSKLSELFQGRPAGVRFWVNIVVACIPAAVIGLLFEKKIKGLLFTPTVVAISLIVGGIILYVVEQRRSQMAHAEEQAEPDLDSITMRQALWVGAAQVLAVVFPGTSRSGASIVGGLLSGMNRVTATAFSFFLGIPLLGAAGLYSLYKARHTLSQVEGGTSAMLIGTVISFIVALLSVGWLLRYVSRNDFRGFAIYRIVFGIILLILVAVGVLHSVPA